MKIELRRYKGVWTYTGEKRRLHGKTGSEEVSAPHEDASKIIIRGIASNGLFGDSRQQEFFEVEVEEITDDVSKVIH